MSSGKLILPQGMKYPKSSVPKPEAPTVPSIVKQWGNTVGWLRTKGYTPEKIKEVVEAWEEENGVQSGEEKMKYWLGIDFETTGLDSSVDRVTEIGAVLWDLEKKAPVQVYSQLTWHHQYPEITEHITQLTGIDQPMLDQFAIPIDVGMMDLQKLMKEADHVIAHNAPFDKAFYEAECERALLEYNKEQMWLDSRKDIEYPEDYSQKLQYLAYHHNFINPFAHRAVFDVLTMMRIVSDYNPEEIVKLALEPNIFIRAKVTFQERDKAKQRSFHWRPDEKIWVKEIKKFRYEKEENLAKELGFEIVEVQSDEKKTNSSR